jgi:hypothetical protein
MRTIGLRDIGRLVPHPNGVSAGMTSIGSRMKYGGFIWSGLIWGWSFEELIVYSGEDANS